MNNCPREINQSIDVIVVVPAIEVIAPPAPVSVAVGHVSSTDPSLPGQGCQLVDYLGSAVRAHLLSSLLVDATSTRFR